MPLPSSGALGASTAAGTSGPCCCPHSVRPVLHMAVLPCHKSFKPAWGCHQVSLADGMTLACSCTSHQTAVTSQGVSGRWPPRSGFELAHPASYPSTNTQPVTRHPRSSGELPSSMQRLPAACNLPAGYSELLSAAPNIRQLATFFPDAANVSAQAAQRRLIDYTSSLVAQQRSRHKPKKQRPGHTVKGQAWQLHRCPGDPELCALRNMISCCY